MASEYSVPFSLSVLTILTLLFASMPLLADTSAQDVEGSVISVTDFEYRRLYREGDLLYRAAFGDFIPDNGHVEMAACSKNGRITVTYGSDMTWTTELAEQVFIGDNPNDPAEVYSVASHDLYPEYPGDELISVDMDYNVRMTRYHDGEWVSEVIFTDPGVDWLYEIAVGELIEDIPGPEMVIVGDSQRATLVKRVNGVWTGELMFKDNFGLDTCFIDDIDPDDPGNEVVVGGTDGNLTMISGSTGNWVHRDIAYFGSPIIDVLTQDLDPSIPGREVYASTFSGKVYKVFRDSSGYGKEMVHDEGAMAYGLEAGTIEGEPVVAMATWNSRVALLHYDSGFRVKEVYREDYYLLGTGIHDIDPYHKGNEIVGLSVLGYLTMIYHDDPGVDMILPFDRSAVSLNEDLELPFILRYKGGYAGPVTLTVDRGYGGPIFYDEGGANSIVIMGSSEPGTLEVELNIQWEGGSRKRSFFLEVQDHNRSISFSTAFLNGTVGADKQLVRTFSVLSQNDVGAPMIISSSGLPAGIGVEILPDAVDALGNPLAITSTVRVQPETEIMVHDFFITGSNIFGMNRSLVFSVDVQEASTADFDLIIQSPPIDLSKGENVTLDLLVVSTSGFDSEVELNIKEPIDDLSVSFSETRVIPTATVQVTVTVLEDSGPYFINIEGSSGSLVREDSIRIDTMPPEKYLDIRGDGEPVILKEEDGRLTGEFRLTLEPFNGIIENVKIRVESSFSNISISTSPSSISRIPYRLNVTFHIEMDSENTKDVLSLNFTTGERSWPHDISLEYPENDESGQTGSSETPIMIAVIVMILLAAFLLVFVNRGNIINRQQEVEDDHGADDGHSKVGAAYKRHHGRTGRLDRPGRRGR